MKKLAKLLIIASTLSFAACADMGIENPFSTSSEVSEVYMAQFPDVPIPRDMTLDTKRSLVSTAADGTRIGLETYDGRVDVSSLAKAMAYNMTGRGWTFIGQILGKKVVQSFEKDNRLVIVYISEGMVYSDMEIWVLSKLQAGVGITSNPAFEQLNNINSNSIPQAPGGMQTYTLDN